MTEICVLYFEDITDTSFSWAVFDSKNQLVRGPERSVLSAFDATQFDEIWAILPNRLILNAILNLPLMPKKQLFKAIPYALEDNLLTDPQLMHTTVVCNEEERQFVQLIEQSVLEDFLASLAEQGIQLSALYPEISAYYSECFATGSIFVSHEFAVANLEGTQFLQTPLSTLGNLLEALSSLPDRLTLYSSQDDQVAALESLSRFKIDSQFYGGWVTLAKRLLLAKPPHLLRGRFMPGTSKASSTRIQRLAMGLGTAFIALTLTGLMTQTFLFQNRLKTTNRELTSLVKTVSPNVRPDHIKRDLTRLLDYSHRALSGDDFLNIMRHMGPVLKANAGVRLDSLRYGQRVMEVSLTAPELSQMNAFYQALTKTGLSVERRNVMSRVGEAKAQLRVKEVAL